MQTCGLCNPLAFTESTIASVIPVNEPLHYALFDTLIENKSLKREYECTKGRLAEATEPQVIQEWSVNNNS